MNIGKKIKDLRLKHNITQECLAEKLNITPQAVCKWENGNTMPDIALLPELSAFFGVTIDELFELTDDIHMERINNMVESQLTVSESDFDYAEKYLTEHFHNEHSAATLARLYNTKAHEFHKKAEFYAKKALETSPDHKSTHSALCEAAGGVVWDWNLQNHHSLIDYYYQLINKNPKVWITYVWLTENLIADMRLKEAEEMIGKLEQIKTTPHILRLKFRLEIKRGDFEAAEKYLTELTDTYDDAIAWSYKADAYAGLSRYEEAIACYKKAVTLETPPRYTDNYICLAHIYEITKDYPNAIGAYKNVIEVLKSDYNAPSDGEMIQYYETKIAGLAVM